MNDETHDKALYDYYNARAPFIDKGYEGDPHAWTLGMIADMHAALAGRRVLEIACGTGHWTQFAAEVAEHVTAVDVAPNMLAIARSKIPVPPNVSFRAGDAYALEELPGAFDAGLAMQWFSHVPRARHDAFLAGWHGRLGSGAVVFMGDNQLTGRWRDLVFTRPGEPDTYEPRELPDGSKHEILKNYFEAEELRQIFGPRSRDLRLTMGASWWWLSYVVT